MILLNEDLPQRVIPSMKTNGKLMFAEGANLVAFSPQDVTDLPNTVAAIDN